MTLPVFPGLSAIAAAYDGFILDLWGVIHDGTTPYPGVVDTLKALKAAGKHVLILSNAPRRAQVLIDGLAGMNIARDLYGPVMSSGEAVRNELESRADPAFAQLGTRLYHLGPPRDRNIFDGLAGIVEADLASAHFVLNTGPIEFDHQVADYEDVLSKAAARHLPMVCANPDRVVVRQGKMVICAGALADRYRELGGHVIDRGKPDPAIYRTCLAKLGVPAAQVLVVGDSLETDIAGGLNAGLDCVMVAGGVHREALGIAWGAMPDPEKVTALATRHHRMPKAVIPAFVW